MRKRYLAHSTVVSYVRRVFGWTVIVLRDGRVFHANCSRAEHNHLLTAESAGRYLWQTLAPRAEIFVEVAGGDSRTTVVGVYSY